MTEQHIVIDGQSFSSDLNYFYFEGYHEISDMDELQKLSLFPALTGATFGDTGLNDQGLAHLCAIASLENLNLQDTEISDQGLAHLKRLPKLKYLRLKENAQLTNACIPHLATLQHLLDLEIQGCSIDQQGLAQLTTMTSLKDICLSVRGDNFTYEGLLAISAQMPDCNILAKGRGTFQQGHFSGHW